jgi:hypothetical protein
MILMAEKQTVPQQRDTGPLDSSMENAPPSEDEERAVEVPKKRTVKQHRDMPAKVPRLEVNNKPTTLEEMLTRINEKQQAITNMEQTRKEDIVLKRAREAEKAAQRSTFQYFKRAMLKPARRLAQPEDTSKGPANRSIQSTPTCPPKRKIEDSSFDVGNFCMMEESAVQQPVVRVNIEEEKKKESSLPLRAQLSAKRKSTRDRLKVKMNGPSQLNDITAGVLRRGLEEHASKTGNSDAGSRRGEPADVQEQMSESVSTVGSLTASILHQARVTPDFGWTVAPGLKLLAANLKEKEKIRLAKKDANFFRGAKEAKRRALETLKEQRKLARAAKLDTKVKNSKISNSNKSAGTKNRSTNNMKKQSVGGAKAAITRKTKEASPRVSQRSRVLKVKTYPGETESQSLGKPIPEINRRKVVRKKAKAIFQEKPGH